MPDGVTLLTSTIPEKLFMAETKCAKAPNFLFIMCDQLRHDYLSCYGHPTLETPHIDRLAERGVRFENAYCQSPLCAPSRASFYTGRYQSSHGVCSNDDATQLGEYMLADYLRPLGYRTAVVGKTHSYKDPAEIQRCAISPDSEFAKSAVSGGFEPYEHHEGLYPDPILPVSLGYTRYLNSVGYADANPWQTRANSGIDKNGNLHSGWSLRSSVYPAAVSDEHSETAFTTRRAMDFIDETGNQPWCLHLSYIKPHWPVIAPAPYHRVFEKKHLQHPVRSESERTDPHPVIDAFMKAEYSQNFADDDIRNIVVPAYMGLVKQIDDYVGRLWTFLQDRDLLDNTVIVFTSDHGDYLGDHWLGEKDLFHAPSVKIPFIVVDPNERADSTRGQSLSELTEAVDVVPTFVELAGGQVAIERLEGRSLVPVLRSETSATSWREYAISEIDYCDRSARYELNIEPYECRATMVCDGNWKYIYYKGYPQQLFDLDEDPDELNDLGRHPGMNTVVEWMKEAIFDWQYSLKKRAGLSYDEAMIQGPERDEQFGIIIGRR